MSTPNWPERFTQDVDAMLRNPGAQPAQSGPAEYDEMLHIARQLAGADASSESRVRLALRANLLQRARNSGAQKKIFFGEPRDVPHLVVPQLLQAALLLVVVLGAIWALTRLLPGNNLQPAAVLSLESSPAEILELATNALWSAVWVDGTLQELNEQGEWQTTRFQLWLDRSGLGRALQSDPQPGLLDRVVDVPVRYASISDGVRMRRYDLSSGLPDPAYENYGWVGHPLENAGAYMALLFPNFLRSEGGSFKVVGQEQAAGLDALVVEWTPAGGSAARHRIHIDITTGALLSHKVLAEDGLTVMREVQVRGIVFEVPFPPVLATEAAALGASFTDGPQPADASLDGVQFELLPTPEPAPQPTEYALPPSPTVTLELGAAPEAIDSQAGELTYLLTDFQSMQRSIVRVSAACVLSQASCPAQLLPVAGGGQLFWSPDGERAAMLEHSSSQLWLLSDPQDNGWQVLAEAFQATTELLVWSPDGAWIAASQAGSDGDSTLLLIRADGSELRPLASELDATKLPLGWLDAQTLLFLRFGSGGKGLGEVVGQGTPALYRVDIDSGASSELPGLSGMGLVLNYPGVSPGGQSLALVNGEPAMLGLYDLASGQLNPLAGDLAQPQWSPDGSWIAGVSTQDGLPALEALQPATGERRRLFAWPSVPVFAWAPDSQHLAIEASPRPEDLHARQYLVDLNAALLREVLVSGDNGQLELRYPAWRK